jgi:hypothetical protein
MATVTNVKVVISSDIGSDASGLPMDELCQMLAIAIDLVTQRLRRR